MTLEDLKLALAIILPIAGSVLGAYLKIREDIIKLSLQVTELQKDLDNIALKYLHTPRALGEQRGEENGKSV